MKGYKAFEKGMKCRGFQYEENKIFEEDVKPELYERGLHFCQMPLDVLNYYPLNSEFAEVEALGEMEIGEDKISTNKLQIKSKIPFTNLFKAHFDLIFERITANSKTTNTSGYKAHANTSGDEAHANTSGYKAHANTSGDEAHANTSGYYAHANTSGYYAHANTSGYKAHANTSGYKAHANTSGDEAHANTSGYKAHANTSGYYAHANTSGNYAHANTSGNYAHANTSGNYAHANTSGYYAHANTSGNYAHANTSRDEAVACSLGIYSKAKAINGWIIIVDWRRDDEGKWYIENIHNAKVGQKILDIKIKSDVWYWFYDGTLKSEE